MVTNPGIPQQIIGQFFGVGSIGETEYQTPLEYIASIAVPYAFQITSNHDEDMIRQIAYLINGFEDSGDFVLDLDLYTYQDIVQDKNSLLFDKAHSRATHLFETDQKFPIVHCAVLGSEHRHYRSVEIGR